MISAGEREFVKRLVNNGIRVDGRGFNDRREVECREIDQPQADYSLFLKMGTTELEIYVRIISNEPNKIPPQIPDFYEKLIIEPLEKLGLGIQIELVYDEENVYDLLFYGLNYIFRSFSVPDLSNLTQMIDCPINLPLSKTYSVIDNKFLYDPCLLEYKSSDGVLHIFSKENFYIKGKIPLELLNHHLL